jgi:hypothetical protein
MAKFWRAIRNIVQNIPIPGVGVSVQQVKDIGAAIKGDPGGTITYTPPPQKQASGAPIETKVQRISPWFLAAVVAGLILVFRQPASGGGTTA